MCKELYDDILRWKRDKEINYTKYEKFTQDGHLVICNCCDLRVGDIVKVNANERIPADLLLINTRDKNGTVFIKTDQLDGETDWKLRKSVGYTQNAYSNMNISLKELNGYVIAENPHRNIYDFKGVFHVNPDSPHFQKESLSVENTMWANTVLANGNALGMVLYTGMDTRSQLNSRSARSKVGKLDLEVNKLAVILFVLVLILSFIIILLNGFTYNWYLLFFRYILLLSAIIPISLRVNLDLAKLWYSIVIQHDKKIPDTIVRNTNIPEELGRVQYLFSDKTGTLTQNVMKFKRLYVDDIYYDASEGLEDVRDKLFRHCKSKLGPATDLETNHRREGRAFRRQREAIVNLLYYI